MRPNIEEIRERVDHCLSMAFFSPEAVREIVSNAPGLLNYIDELENMPLVQTIVDLQQEVKTLNDRIYNLALENVKLGGLKLMHQEENKKLRETLNQIESWTRFPNEYQPSLSSVNYLCRQALEGANS